MMCHVIPTCFVTRGGVMVVEEERSGLVRAGTPSMASAYPCEESKRHSRTAFSSLNERERGRKWGERRRIRAEDIRRVGGRQTERGISGMEGKSLSERGCYRALCGEVWVGLMFWHLTDAGDGKNRRVKV